MRIRREGLGRGRALVALVGIGILAACTSAPPSSEVDGTESSALSPIPALFPTGIAADGSTLLAVGAVDPHYTITATTDTNVGTVPAKVYVVTPNPNWTANSATGQWVSPFPSTGGSSNVTYTYSTTFTVAAQTSTASLSGTWSCDNYCVAYLNGVPFATAGNATTNGFNQTFTFAAPTASAPLAQFVSGSNTLAFVVTNTAGGNPNPTGLAVLSLTSQEGCYQDSNCTAAQYCNTPTSVCTAKVANGVTVPTVAGHTNPTLNGTCNPAATVGPDVCTSAVCDVNDNKCGYNVGDGPCTQATAATVCRSGACSADGLCEPAGGCLVDADCTAATQYCNTPTETCVAKLANGVTVPNVVGHTNPTLNGTCNPAATVGPDVCTSAVCDASDNKCGYATGDGSCTQATASVCRSGACSTGGACGCLVDSDCTSAQYCNTPTATCTAKLPNNTLVPTVAGHSPTLDSMCSPAATIGPDVCASLVCDANDNKCGYAAGDGACTAGTAGTVCRSGACSTGGACGCKLDTDCTSAQYCNTPTATCTTKLANGVLVPTVIGHTNPTLVSVCNPAATVGPDVCASLVCDAKDNKCGLNVGDGPCTAGTAATVCRSGACSVSGVCQVAGSCLVDGDCASGQWCNETTSTCTAVLANGTKLPTDSAHANPTLNGSCTTAAGMLVCQSGVCDASNSECGYAAGDGPCTAATGATVCQSGVCSVSGVCEVAGSCLVDGDCATGQWCNETTSTCTAVLANGVTLPTDAAHANPTLNGSCTAAAGALVCQSSVCDASNSECGYAAGDGPCTAATGATVCQSGVCSVSGVCEAAGSCLVDGDCTSAQWCNEAMKSCVAKIGNGVAVPSDPSHTSPTLNGTCTAAAATAVCQSTVCDSKNSECGYAVGDGPCTAATGAALCQSGACSVSGVCEPSGGCRVDGDCTVGAATVCNTVSSTCVVPADGGTADAGEDAGADASVPTGPTYSVEGGGCTVSAANGDGSRSGAVWTLLAILGLVAQDRARRRGAR